MEKKKKKLGIKIEAGKGCRPRPCDMKKYGKNYEKIFKHR